jgi:tetratricopeptide (TPR) repeat protein
MRAQPLALLALIGAALALRGGVEEHTAAWLGLGVGVVGACVAVARKLPPLPPVVVLVAVGWSALALVSVTWSPNRDASLDAAVGALALCVGWLLGATLTSPELRRQFTLGLAALGAIVAALALGTAELGERAAFPLRNPNHLGAWLLLPACFALVALLDADLRRRGDREAGFLWFGVLGILGAGIAATGSRGVALAGAFAAASLVLLRRVGPRSGLPMVAGALATAAVALMVLPWLAPQALAWAGGGGDSSAGLRWTVYSASARAALDAAPLGTGIGSFAVAFDAKRPPGLAYSAGFAHNEALHGLVELGIPFLLLSFVTAVVISRLLIRRLSRGLSRVSWGALTGLIALAGHALVDFPLHVPAIALVGAVLAGLVTAGVEGAPARVWRPDRAALAVLSAALLFLGGTQAVATWLAHDAEVRFARGDFTGSLDAIEWALVARPARASLRAQAADAAEHVYLFGGGGQPWLERALAERTRAVAADPANARRFVERARTRALALDATGALADLVEAQRRDPQSPVASLAQSRAWMALGEPSQAARELRHALERHPRATPDLVAAALADTGDAAWVRAAVTGLEASERDAAAVMARAGYWHEAAELFASIAARTPHDASAGLSAAELFVRSGATQSARVVLARLGDAGGDDARMRRVRNALVRAGSDGAWP